MDTNEDKGMVQTIVYRAIRGEGQEEPEMTRSLGAKRLSVNTVDHFNHGE